MRYLSDCITDFTNYLIDILINIELYKNVCILVLILKNVKLILKS